MTSVFDDLWRPVPVARGGWRMQLVANAAQPPVRQSHAVLRNLADYGIGRISVMQVWRHMDALAHDGFEHPRITRLYAVARHDTDNNARHNLQPISVAVLGLENWISEAGETERFTCC